MDARTRLKVYLEQRRDLGESELVLDSLPVADVLALLGAAPGQGAPRKTRETPRAGAAASASPPADVTAPESQSAAAAPAHGGPAEAPAWLRALSEPLGMHVGDVPLHALAPAGDSLDAVAAEVAACGACSLANGARSHVPGEGNPDADFVCVGEAPGAQEDRTGRPFVGDAGELLTKILSAIHFSREQVFICNVLKHRPPGNRDPLPNEVTACAPFLVRQLALLRPKVILALGRFAGNTLLGTDAKLADLRGKVHRYHGIPLVVTYHPSALLRNPDYKRPAWGDVQLARRVYDAAPRGEQSA